MVAYGEVVLDGVDVLVELDGVSLFCNAIGAILVTQECHEA